MTLASLAKNSARIYRMEVYRRLGRLELLTQDVSHDYRMNIGRAGVESLAEIARDPSCQALRLESINHLYCVLHTAPELMKEQARQILEYLRADMNPIVAAYADVMISYDPSAVGEILEPFGS